MRGDAGAWGSGRSGSRAAVAVVLVGLAAGWLLAGCDSADPTPTDPSTSNEASDAAPSSSDPGSSSDRDWGAVEPPNLDRLRDFSDPVFPDQVGDFELDGEPAAGGASVIASYVDWENARIIQPTVLDGWDNFEWGASRLSNPQVVGDAVCDVDAEVPDTVHCYVAGSTATLEITAPADVTVQEAGEFATELASLL